MSGNTDPFLVLVDDIGALRRQIENLQRTSLDRDEAEHLNATIAKSLDNMAQTGKRLEQRLEGQLQLATAKTNLAAIEAAQDAARGAIRESHAEILQTARSLSQAAGEARREAWRWFGGFWVWLASIGAAGALIGALAREVGMSRVGLNKALSGDGNPTLSTVMKVAKALGLKVSIQPGA